MPATPTVFISYSHRDEAWKDLLVPQLRALEQAGVGLQVWHDRKIDGGDQWYPEIREAMTNAAGAVLLISADFLASAFCVQEEVPALLKRQEEQGMLLIPVLLKPCVWKAHRWLKDRQMLPRDGKCVAIDFANNLADAVFAAVAEQVLAHFERLASQPEPALLVPPPVQSLAAQRSSIPDPAVIAPAPAARWPVLAAARIDLTHLPATGRDLFGRDEELKLLDEAWTPSKQSDAVAAPVRILAFTAHGGVGKSTLVNHWLAEMAPDDYRGATRVFGWSFFSQGVRAEAVASADLFIAAALRFFGDADPTVGSPWEKGERLAGLIGAERALLVLDGMERLQSAHVFERGKLRDPSLEALLRGLARRSAGLCVITTREPLADLAGRAGVLSRDLEQISPEAGRALLRTLRVVGTDAELEALARRFGPHALAVSLLGVYLREHPGHGIGPAQALERLPGARPIDRVLAGFEQWLGESPAREALRLLGFFDRPADPGCLRTLRVAPAIPGLTGLVAGLGEAEWNRALDRLEKLRLIHVQENELGDRWVDAHPVIREHFAEQLKGTDAWREGHRRLYEHLCATSKEGDQPTLEDLQPLYQAVAHGCQGGEHQKACNEIFFTRIRKGDQDYAAKLGAFGSELGAVACFFDPPWKRVSSYLTKADQAWLLSVASYDLRALGRLTEALEPMMASREMYVQQGLWRNAAQNALNLSELELTLGEVAGAVGDAEHSVTYADHSGDVFKRYDTRAAHADALHHAGHRAEAETRFREAEQIQQEGQPDYQLLYSLPGFRYCDLLLAAPERAAWQEMLRSADDITRGSGIDSALVDSCRSVSQRAAQTLKIAEEYFGRGLGLLDLALDHLTLGRAALYAAILAGRATLPRRRAEQQLGPADDAFATARSELGAAVDGLRRAGQMTLLPRGLLTRAWLRFLTGTHTGPGSAQEDLDEAWEVAERGPMRLFMARHPPIPCPPLLP